MGVEPQYARDARPSSRQTAKLFLLLWGSGMVLWLLFSQDFAIFALLAGLALSFLASLFMIPHYRHSLRSGSVRIPLRLDLFVAYFLYLVIQSYVSSFMLIRLMLSRRYTPGIIRVRTRLRSRIGQTMLANTITLIPGTLSVWINRNHIYVHWFDRKSRHRIEAGKLIVRPIEALLEKLFD